MAKNGAEVEIGTLDAFNKKNRLFLFDRISKVIMFAFFCKTVAKKKEIVPLDSNVVICVFAGGTSNLAEGAVLGNPWKHKMHQNAV